jgi:hypothetical protein
MGGERLAENSLPSKSKMLGNGTWTVGPEHCLNEELRVLLSLQNAIHVFKLQRVR